MKREDDSGRVRDITAALLAAYVGPRRLVILSMLVCLQRGVDACPTYGYKLSSSSW